MLIQYSVMKTDRQSKAASSLITFFFGARFMFDNIFQGHVQSMFLSYKIVT